MSLSNRVEIKSQNLNTDLTKWLYCASTYVSHLHVENSTFKHRLVSDSMHFFKYKGEKAKQNFSELFLLRTSAWWKGSVTSARYLKHKQGRFSKTISLAYQSSNLDFRLGIVQIDSTPVVSATKYLVWDQTFLHSSINCSLMPDARSLQVSSHCLYFKACDTENSSCSQGQCFQIRQLCHVLQSSSKWYQ